MEGGKRSGDQSEIYVKKRNSSGCLIVRKKSGDGVADVGSSSRLKKVKKRARPVLSDSEASDELPPSPRSRVAPETLRLCNGLSSHKGTSGSKEFDRKRRMMHNEESFGARNGEDRSEVKRNRLDVFEFDEYEDFNDSGSDYGGRKFLGSMHVAHRGRDRVYEGSSSRHASGDRRKSHSDRGTSLNKGDYPHKSKFVKRNDGSFFGNISVNRSDESIRLQGKNGVLKVMVNKKKNVAGSLKHYDQEEEVEESRKISVDLVKKNVPVPVPAQRSSLLEDKTSNKKRSFDRMEKRLSMKTSISSGSGESSESDDEEEEEEDEENRKLLKSKSKKSVPQSPSENSCHDDEKTPLAKLPQNRMMKAKVKTGNGAEKPELHDPPTRVEGKGRRGSGTGTEKQKLREHIKKMLVAAGWTIDYRPRRNRDYLDAVYINPSGTAFWSIIKAYDAFQKQLDDEDHGGKSGGDGSSFTPLSDKVLSQLTRKTKKKLNREMKRKKKDGDRSAHEEEAAPRGTMNRRNYVESTDDDSEEEKLSSFIKKGKKSFKNRMSENGCVDVKPKLQKSTHLVQGRKKLGRCTLLARSSSKGMNESDGYIPYAGKRTILSWLIDAGAVKLSQKVQYMNRRRSKVLQEGWVTREGIHCGCCSKILTVQKFEIHAGSKLRQPFQNIYLDSGESLLQCQIDAWKRQDPAECSGFKFVDTEGDDPDDDTCGICGDGGDLICCDGCPSTFHQNCLNIEALPEGDWHCPNCTCKFCGVAGEVTTEEDDATAGGSLACTMCEKKYHEPCVGRMADLPPGGSSSSSTFCGQKCKELFVHLQKYLGVRHELDGGFTWSLIHITDVDTDSSIPGLPQRVECNSKLAVALTVMDECFLPIFDRRSGINLIHNVLYNCGSNFNRINYSGFYTAVLERGDEIISAASIRFHGTRLAEMPFIGTRHIYRRQGMCRRLFNAIESTLSTLKVEKMIIPAIAELMHTWTEVFGFSPLKESLKHELRSLNMLVFPGTDMLQKQLSKEENVENKTDVIRMEQKGGRLTDKSDMVSSATCDSLESEDARTDPIKDTSDEAAATKSNSHSPVTSSDDTAATKNSLDSSHDPKTTVSKEEAMHSDSQPGIKSGKPALDCHDSQQSEDGSDHVNKVNDEVVARDCTSQLPDASSDAAAVTKSSECDPLGSSLAECASGEISATHDSGNEVENGDKPLVDPKISEVDHFSGEVMDVATEVNAGAVDNETDCSSGVIAAQKTSENGHVDLNEDMTLTTSDSIHKVMPKEQNKLTEHSNIEAAPDAEAVLQKSVNGSVAPAAEETSGSVSN